MKILSYIYFLYIVFNSDIFAFLSITSYQSSTPIGDRKRELKGDDLRKLEYSKGARHYEDELNHDVKISDLDEELIKQYKETPTALIPSNRRVLSLIPNTIVPPSAFAYADISSADIENAEGQPDRLLLLHIYPSVDRVISTDQKFYFHPHESYNLM